MELWDDDENGDKLIEREGIIVARVPAIVEQKFPGTGSLLAASEDLLRELEAMVVRFHGYQGMELDSARKAIARAQKHW